jgi:hypothetical protein
MKQVFNMAMARVLCDAVRGSGLDSEPWIAQSKRGIVIGWDFHLMDDQGYYRGYWRFIVRIPKTDPLEFHLTGRRGNTRSALAYDLKGYLEERFADAITSVLGSAAVVAELCDGKWRYGGGVAADV